MRPHIRSTACGLAAQWACCLALAGPAAAFATTLSDNTSETSSGTVEVTGSSWAAASFDTDTSYSSATLTATLLASTSSGAVLSLYSSDSTGLIPDTSLADFTLSTSSTDSATYTLTNTTLSASTHYWLVLHNTDGDTLWSWTASSSGTGTGFTGVWANSDDAAATWFTNSALYPVQLSVAVSGTSAVPEPGTMQLSLAALPLLAFAIRRRSNPSRA